MNENNAESLYSPKELSAFRRSDLSESTIDDYRKIIRSLRASRNTLDLSPKAKKVREKKESVVHSLESLSSLFG